MPNTVSSRSSRLFRAPAAIAAIVACIAAPAMYASVRMSADAHTTAPAHHGAIVRESNKIVVRDAWARPASGTGVVYFTLQNTSSHDVTLTGVTTSRAAKASLHESYAVAPRPQGDGHGPAGHDMGGMMMTATAMRPIKSLHIPAHGTMAFTTGGRHVMLDGLRGELHRGQTFAITLHFKDGMTKVAAVQVR